jgi:hypothetical protein
MTIIWVELFIYGYAKVVQFVLGDTRKGAILIWGYGVPKS